MTPVAQLLVIAKQPEPGRVKTRLCPPCTPTQAAQVAAAALHDTLGAVARTPARRRVLVLDGQAPRPGGFEVVPQRGDGLGARLAHGFADSALPDTPSLLIGMDTPQVTPGHLGCAAALLDHADAVLGLAYDGGWWALGLRRPEHAAVLAMVPMSTSDTGRLTAEALRGQGLRVAALPVLRDVDDAADAHAVAAVCDGGRFPHAVARLVPGGGRRTSRDHALLSGGAEWSREDR